MGLLDDLKRMMHPINDEDDEDYMDFDDQESPFLESHSRSDRSSVDSRRGKVVNIHATTQLKVSYIEPIIV